MRKLWQTTIRPLFKLVVSDAVRKWIVVGALALLVLDIAHGCRQDGRVTRYQRQAAAWQDTAAKRLEINKKLQVVVDSVMRAADSTQKEAAKQTAAISGLRSTLKTQRAANDSLLRRLSQLPKSFCDSICGEWRIMAINFRTEADTAERALALADQRHANDQMTIASLRVGVSTVTAQRDSLLKSVSTVPVYKPEKLLWVVPLPTRTQSFIMGGALGALVTATIIAVVK